jgi:alpha-ketoglutarate-dependent taurine dioxygenase
MALEVHDLTESIATQVRAPLAELLDPATGMALRTLLVDRGVLVFKELHLTDEQQVTLASHQDHARSGRERAGGLPQGVVQLAPRWYAR